MSELYLDQFVKKEIPSASANLFTESVEKNEMDFFPCHNILCQ